MKLYGVMYLYQPLKIGRCFKMRFLYALLFIFSINALSDTLYDFKNENDEIRFNKLIKDIRCPKCISGSLSSSNAPISEDLKLKIIEMIAENKTDQEIKEYVTQRFGSEALYEPQFNETTYILWFSPFVILFFALLIFVFIKKT